MYVLTTVARGTGTFFATGLGILSTLPDKLVRLQRQRKGDETGSCPGN